MESRNPDPVAALLPHLAQDIVKAAGNTGQAALGSLNPSSNPSFSFLVAVLCYQVIHQTDIALGSFCFLFAEGDYLISTAGILEGGSNPIGETVTPIIS